MSTETWRALGTAVTYAANKDMLSVFNGAASTKVLRIYRMYAFNNQTGAVTGVLNFIQIWRQNTAPSGGTAVTPVAHSPSNTALNAATTAGHNQTVTNEVMLRQMLNSPDEPAVSTLDMDSLWTLVPYAEIWNAGYGDTNIQPLTCPSGLAYGYGIKSVTQTVGLNDFEIEFTNAAS